jgi:membrane associated rhomboid family serine protease
MNAVAMHPLEAILRHCAAAEPDPWYPREYAQSNGLCWDDLADCLDDLWLEGLIQKSRGDKARGPAIVLSREGKRVLDDPEALERLRNGQSSAPGGRAAIVPQSLRYPRRPVLTRLLVLANVAVFAYGIFQLFPHKGPLKEFLLGPLFRGQPPQLVVNVWEQSGLLTTVALIHGEWWRLLSAAFVHLGLLHLGLNMLGVYSAGRLIEQTWGGLRFLVIYLFGAFGASCAAVVYQPEAQMGGASGALCGLVAAFGVWLLFNGRYLPRSLVLRMAISFLISSGLIIGLSLIPGVSGWGHLGGAVAGGIAALLLDLHRFTRPPLRWLALASLLVLPWVGYGLMERARATDPRWHKEEEKEFVRFHARRVHKASSEGIVLYRDHVQRLLEQGAKRREGAAVEKLLPELEEQHKKLTELAASLAKAGPYRDEDVENARRTAQEYLAARADLFERTERCFRLGEGWTEKDKQALEQQQDKVKDLRGKWEQLWAR